MFGFEAYQKVCVEVLSNFVSISLERISMFETKLIWDDRTGTPGDSWTPVLCFLHCICGGTVSQHAHCGAQVLLSLWCSARSRNRQLYLGEVIDDVLLLHHL